MSKVNSIRKSKKESARKARAYKQVVRKRSAAVWVPNIKGTRFDDGKRVPR